MADHLANIAMDDLDDTYVECCEEITEWHSNRFLLISDGGFRPESKLGSYGWGLSCLDVDRHEHELLASGYEHWHGASSAFESEVIGIDAALELASGFVAKKQADAARERRRG